MKVIYLTAGAAGMYCGSCMHDNSLARAMIAEGVDTLLVPTYTPIRTDEMDVSVDKVFFGGVNIYLQQLAPWLKYTPRWLDQFLNSPKLIRWVASRGMETSPKQLGALTVSMLRGKQGNQRKEVDRLCDWLAREIKPDALVLTNMLIAGFVPDLKKSLKVPVAVTLQGDDIFLDYLPEPYRQQTIDVMQQLVGGIDAFIAHSRDYGQRMATVLNIPPGKLHIMPLAIDTTPFHQQADANRSMPEAPTVGYMARLAPEKGLHLLVDAFVKLHEDQAMRSTRLRIAGWLGPSNQDYWEKQKQKIAAAGLSEFVSYEGEIDHRHKVDFMHGVDVLCVPTTYRDPKGLFVLEALASGTPVIVPAHGAFPEMLQRLGGGWLVSPDDVDSITEKLRWIFTNREEAARLGREAWPAVLRHADIRSMAQQTIALLKNLQNT
ncbi:MAG: GDP-mannose-dependent alpha-(1-6)-phosphatidylinositol monomannoside mannosyltransferase [Planctomycetota bacterium]